MFLVLVAALCLLSGDAEAKPKAPVCGKMRRVELRIGLVPFNDPRKHDLGTPANTMPREEKSLRAYLAEVKRLYGGDCIDLEIKLIKGNYYQILYWMREGLLDGAVVSSFTAHLLTTDPNLALLPMTEFARASSGALFSVQGKGAESQETALGDCLKKVEESLSGPLTRSAGEPPQQPCEFRFVSHLSTTGFIVPLIYIEEQFVRPGGMSLPKQQAFWTRLLQWSRLELLHDVIEHEPKGATTIAFSYVEGADRCPVPLPKDRSVTNLADVLLLGCRRSQPGQPPKTDDERRRLLEGCAEVNSFVGSLPSSDTTLHWLEAGAAIEKTQGDKKGYIRATTWNQKDRTEFAERIESVFLPQKRTDDGVVAAKRKEATVKPQETALSALYTRWYRDGRYAFSIDEVIDVLKVDQIIRNAPRAALVLPGGGVRATYQSVILDYLYDKRIINVGYKRMADAGSTHGEQCLAPEMPAGFDKQLLVINGIAGTSGGALLGYFASRRDTSNSDALTKLWIDGTIVRTTPLDVFPALGVLRWLSLIVLVAVFAATSAVHMSRSREPLKAEVPFWYTTFLTFVVIAAPLLIWFHARDPADESTFEAMALMVIILVAHFVHSVSADGEPPTNPRWWQRRGIAAIGGGFLLIVILIKSYESPMAQNDWKRTISGLWALGMTEAFIVIVLGLSFMAAARGLHIRTNLLHEYREALFLLLLLFGLSFIVFFVGWRLNRVTPLEMTIDYWLWVFIAAVFSAKLIITGERVYESVPLLKGIRFLCSPSGTAPFPYTPAGVLVMWGGLGIVVWLMFIAPAVYSSHQGRSAFNKAAKEWSGKERVPLIVSMTGLGDNVLGFRAPPYRGDYYAVDEQWCLVDELQGKTSARLFRRNKDDFKDAVFASGSPFPIYPATPVQAEDADKRGLFVDGGFAHRVPIEAAGLVRAAQILVVENVARTDVPESSDGLRPGALPTNGAKVLDFLFERSQTIDGQRARSAVVATIYPDWSPPNPFLMDFRASVVQRLRDEGVKDLEGHRVARIESWGEPTEEIVTDEP